MDIKTLLVYTSPHTGSHFVQDLLVSHSKIGAIWTQGVSGCLEDNSTDFLFERFINGSFTLTDLHEYILCAITLVKEKPEILPRLREYMSAITQKEVKGIVEDSSFLYSVIVSHSLPPRTKKRYWASDLILAGYTGEALVTLRDPIKGAMTERLRSFGLEYDWRTAYSNNAYAFDFIVDFVNTVPTFIFPVDLPKSRDIAYSLFDSFLELDMEIKTEEKINLWDKVFSLTGEEIRNRIPLSDKNLSYELEKLLEMRRRLNSGMGIFGMDKIVDAEITRYRNSKKIRSLFESAGYTDLEWF